MRIFFFILSHNILPVFFIIFLGYVIGKKFNLDISSLSKINFYAFVPALVFVKIYETQIQLSLLKAILFGVLFLLVQTLSSILLSKLLKHSTAMSSAFTNSIMFYNCGNFSLPLIALIFSDSNHSSYALSIQIMILMVQNLSIYTLGFYNAGRSKMHYLETFKFILRMPSIYAIAGALILKTFPYNLKGFFLWPAMLHLKNGLIPVALLTLGVQLSLTKLQIRNTTVYIASLMRLCISPFFAYLLILILDIEGIMAKVLFISSSVPSAVNTALIAVELNNEPDFASQVVLTTTLMSALTLTIVIFLSHHLF